MSSGQPGRSRPTGLAPGRVRVFRLVAGLIFAVFILRLFSLQVLQGERWTGEAEANRIETISLPTLRGVIYDRNGIVLARNIASYNIAVTPALLPEDPGEVEEIVRGLSQFTDLPIHRGDVETDPLIQCGDNLGIAEMIAVGTSFAPFQPVLIECDVPREVALIIQERAADWPGVSIQVEPVRDYPTGGLTSTFIGYLGPIPAALEEQLRALGFLPARDKIGYAGLELYFDPILRGSNGQRVVEVDVAGEVLRDLAPVTQPQPGQNLVLTIDTRLQQAADAILKNEIELWNQYFATLRITSAVAIAINPRTGEILAMVSYPTYENNRMARFIPQYYYEQLLADATYPLLNKAVGAELPAGSVFKIVTGIGALNEGVIEPDQIIQTPGLITVTESFYANDPGRAREFVDWNRAGFGSLDFIGCIANSSNVCLYKLGGGFRDEIPQGLGICRLGTYARALGYGQYLGIELPDETDGLIPDPTWKRINQGENWSTGDTYIASVGQGFVIASPLQVLMSAAVVANDGVLMRPTIVREVVDGEGKPVQVLTDDDGNLLTPFYDAAGNLLGLDADGNPVPNANVVSPFTPDIKWDLTQDARIQKYENPDGIGSCKEIEGELVTIEPWVINMMQRGMRQAVVNGTLTDVFEGITVAAAGKTGTAEYCDATALAKNLCIPGNWPTHSWTVAYAPYDNPEIAVVAFLYNGGEGASVAGPVVFRILEAYFELKAIDASLGGP
jgi:penicillin-binding protein 2